MIGAVSSVNMLNIYHNLWKINKWNIIQSDFLSLRDGVELLAYAGHKIAVLYVNVTSSLTMYPYRFSYFTYIKSVSIYIYDEINERLENVASCKHYDKWSYNVI